MGFADETRVGLHGMVRQFHQLLYEWWYLFLAVHGQQGRLFWCWMPALTAAETHRVIRGLQKATDRVGLVWDRARSHTDKTVHQLGMPLVSLPPSSPELNRADRVFETLRRAAEGAVSASLDDKVAAITDELRRSDADPDQVRSLAVWN